MFGFDGGGFAQFKEARLSCNSPRLLFSRLLENGENEDGRASFIDLNGCPFSSSSMRTACLSQT